MMRLSHEMFTARNSIFELSIGELVAAQAISSMQFSYVQHAKLFRRHLYRMGRGGKGTYTAQRCITHPKHANR